MKVSINWLKELVDLKVSIDELISLLPLRTIGLKDVTEGSIELDMKGYNRPDLLYMRGVALEVAAITNSQVNIPELTEDWKDLHLPQTPVSVEQDLLCPIQGVAKIEGLKVDKSSLDWIEKLNSCGMRTVNDIADVTNLVMLEYGQPLHAFDASTIKDDTINVRLAENGEKITTLDGKLRELTSEDIVLSDTEKALDVAGVMGGKNTEIKDSTNTILLSASLFNPARVRKTATRLRLQSEASRRFYHGLTSKNLFLALNAAIKMYESLGGKVTALTITGNYETTQKPINLNYEKVKSLIGIEIDKSQIVEYLTKLHFGIKEVSENEWEVIPPYWRLDIEFPEDLIEEVARMYGYEKIPAQELVGQIPPKIDQTKFDRNFSLKKTLAELGLTEIQTYSFFSNEVLDNLQLDKKLLIKLSNPISSETEYLRNALWPNIVETIVKNQKQNFQDTAIFEIGKIYDINESGEIVENYHLVIGLMNKTDNPMEELYEIFKKLNTKLKLGTELGGRDKAEIQKSFFHPTRFVNLTQAGKVAGLIAEVHPRIINKFGIEKRIAVLELIV